MSLTLPSLETAANLDELSQLLGGIELARIRYRPRPGTAGEDDLLLSEHPCELVDGVLVEKPMGFYESIVAMQLGRLLAEYALCHDLGVVMGEAGAIRLAVGRVRMPDLAFIPWRHFPGRRLPQGGVLGVAPDLAVEILSPGNTPAEMALKREEYFAAGCRLVWEVDPATRTIRVFTDPTTAVTLLAGDTLSGGEVLPGFEAPVAGLFPDRE